MSKVYIGTADVEDWRKLIRAGHFSADYSAQLTAESWLDAEGFPETLAAIFADAGEPFASLTPLLVFPEHKVALPGGSVGTQSDVWCLAAHGSGLASLSVEGTKGEGFGPTLDVWQRTTTSGRKTRLAYLVELLGLTPPLPQNLRYQFLHRTASAIIEAKRFRAEVAVLVLQSFTPDNDGFGDFEQFLRLMGVMSPITPDAVIPVAVRDGVMLYAVWARSAAK
ncbi:MAG: hypothetical protein H8F28_07800 [Fibrella sp.]|nr:hypothetical protein [Armatimonadota bacterium]